ncbi:hypothetical protein FGO68_gene9391 [Halteria grandinella]|uniref:Uncharacterized protein n=1 Tax=Halteria grandinella TaxID=5974 RepID=A0A8J8NJY4_HALGN|nr:hypothetical protein FGO68_gene9391 [Halteria grandinella]
MYSLVLGKSLEQTIFSNNLLRGIIARFLRTSALNLIRQPATNMLNNKQTRLMKVADPESFNTRSKLSTLTYLLLQRLFTDIAELEVKNRSTRGMIKIPRNLINPLHEWHSNPHSHGIETTALYNLYQHVLMSGSDRAFPSTMLESLLYCQQKKRYLETGLSSTFTVFPTASIYSASNAYDWLV